MSQEENINSIPTTFDIEREYKIIFKNIIHLSHPTKLPFDNFCSRKKSERKKRPLNALFIFRKIVIQELGEHCNNIPLPYFARFIAKKWFELPNDVKKRYGKFASNIREYCAYENRPPTYKIIKF